MSDERDKVAVAVEEEEGCGFTDSASSLNFSTASWTEFEGEGAERGQFQGLGHFSQPKRGGGKSSRRVITFTELVNGSWARDYRRREGKRVRWSQ